MNLLDSIIDATMTAGNGPTVLSEQHNVNAINFVNGLSDPGEMIRCGYLPELRRQPGEQDDAYAERIRPLVMALPQHEQDRIMSAAIRRAGYDLSNGRVNVMVAGEAAWARLGVHVESAVSSEHAIHLAGLDWTVQKVNCFYDWQGVKRESDVFALVRSDTGAHLATVGSRYEPIQNQDAFAYLDRVLNEFGAKYETAGSLHGGKKVWMQAHFPSQDFRLPGNDENKSYVLFENCHDGTGAAYTYATSNRVVCANTLRVAHADSQNGLAIRHTGDVKKKVERARAALGIAVRGFQEFRRNAQVLVNKPLDINHYAPAVLDVVLGVTAAETALREKRVDPLTAATAIAEAERHFERLTKRKANVLDEILERYESPTNTAPGTAWAAFNAVTETLDHGTFNSKGRKGSQEEKLSRMMESAVSGESDAAKQVALTMALGN